MIVTVMFLLICNPQIIADHTNHQYQRTHTESEVQFLEHGMDECVLSLAVCQESVQQQCGEEEHKNLWTVHDAHATYHPEAQCEALSVWQ